MHSSFLWVICSETNLRIHFSLIVFWAWTIVERTIWRLFLKKWGPLELHRIQDSTTGCPHIPLIILETAGNIMKILVRPFKTLPSKILHLYKIQIYATTKVNSNQPVISIHPSRIGTANRKYIRASWDRRCWVSTLAMIMETIRLKSRESING